MNIELAERVKSIVSREMGVRVDRVDLDTRLYHDLNCSGDDGVELMMELRDEFALDLSEFDCGKYFGPEVFPPFLFIYYLFGGDPYVPPLTIRDLVRLAESKKWTEPSPPATP